MTNGELNRDGGEAGDSEPTAASLPTPASKGWSPTAGDDFDYDAAFTALIAQITTPEGELDLMDRQLGLSPEDGVPNDQGVLDRRPSASQPGSGTPEWGGQHNSADLGTPFNGLPPLPASGYHPSGSIPQPPAGEAAETSKSYPWYPDHLDEHFIAPDPPPLPEPDRITRLAWAAVLGGPAFLVLVAVLRGEASGWTVATAVLLFIAGFVTLVARMPDKRDHDGDDGAVL